MRVMKRIVGVLWGLLLLVAHRLNGLGATPVLGVAAP
jgi:hypothetical protein